MKREKKQALDFMGFYYIDCSGTPKEKQKALSIVKSLFSPRDSREDKLFAEFFAEHPYTDQPIEQLLITFLHWLRGKGYHFILEEDLSPGGISRLIPVRNLS